MGRTYPLGRLFGTDIEAGLDFFLMLAYVIFILAGSPGAGAIFALMFVVSILVHEFGHVYAVRKRLDLPSRVILWAFGGLCVYPRLAAEPGRAGPRASDQILISLAGPAFGFALAGLAWLLSRNAAFDPFLRLMFSNLFWFNLILNAANLLPIHPLDGGQAMRAGLASRMGEAKAMAVTRNVSVVTGAAAAMVAFHFGYTIAAILAILLAAQNYMAPRA